MLNIYCDGIFDFFHKGHYLHFKKIKEHFDEPIFLIVGVIDDISASKYKRQPIMNEEKRYSAVDSCIFVDKTIITNMLIINKHFMEKLKIDYVVHGFSNKEDIEKQYNFFDLPRKLNKFITIDYNEGISSTSIIDKYDWTINEIIIPDVSFELSIIFELLKYNNRILEINCGKSELVKYIDNLNYIGYEKDLDLLNKHITKYDSNVINFECKFKTKYFDYTLLNIEDDNLDECLEDIERITRKCIFIDNVTDKYVELLANNDFKIKNKFAYKFVQ